MKAPPGSHALVHSLPVRSTLGDIVASKHSLDRLDGIVRAAKGRGTTSIGAESSKGAPAGTLVLFHGPAGAGKALAAEAIAGTLRVPLYRVDLERISSKYIGETEKNLTAVFEAAEHHGAVLFFDQADALFGKRSEVKDAHDRYANIEVSYLLQKIGDHKGVVILAANRKQAIDTAFLRRLRFTVAFPLPRAG